MAEELHEVDDAEMLEEHYDNEGNDYAMSFSDGGGSDEKAGAPERPTDQDFGRGGNGRGGRGGDW